MSGFQVSRDQGGSDTNGKVFAYNVDAAHTTILAPGDAVKLTGVQDEGLGEVDTASTTGQFLGVINSVDIQSAGENLMDTFLD